jgi:dihydrofolate reductase
LRKLIFAINMSLDGCCDHTKSGISDDTFKYYIDLVKSVDLFVYGRKTHELMVPYWPDVAKDPTSTKSDKDFADAFTSVKKVVFSKSLGESPEDKNTKFVSTDLRDEILKLKQEPGGDILTGGVSIPSQLINLDLVDQYNIVVNPVFVGDGTRLLEGFTLERKLGLIEARSFKSGSVLLKYLKK